MSSLLTLLELEGRRRSLLPQQDVLTAATSFALIRDMPYQRASSREPQTIVAEWRGTCSGKHYALDRIFRELGFNSRVVMCTHRFTPENTGHFPAELRNLLSDEPVPDIHTYLRVESPEGWMTVDATWPASSEPLGMLVNDVFEPGNDMTIACDPIDHYPVPPGVDPQGYKEQLIQEFCGSASAARDRFIEGMSRWLSDST
jgi:hypothetical protein